jgi:hypothetical protein
MKAVRIKRYKIFLRLHGLIVCILEQMQIDCCPAYIWWELSSVLAPKPRAHGTRSMKKCLSVVMLSVAQVVSAFYRIKQPACLLRCRIVN